MDPGIQVPYPKVRRPRAAHACELCRRKKIKCDERDPCSYCRGRGVECVYQNAYRSRTFSAEYVQELERQVKALSSPESSNRSGSVFHHEELRTPASSHTDVSTTNSTDVAMLNRQVQQDPQMELVSHTTSNMSSHFDTYPRPRPPKTVLKEVTAVNRHTKNIEFYGNSSSLAFLSRVQISHQITPSPPSRHEDEVNGDSGSGSLVSQLHSNVLSPSTSSQVNRAEISPGSAATNHHQCRSFVESYFCSIYYIYPMLNKSSFLTRCERLWYGDTRTVTKTFMALYYSVLSLGALVGPKDEDSAESDVNVSWSTKFFDEARALSEELSTTTDLELVQCFFHMAQTCQHLLNPHLSYMYAGLAVRTALAIGINREPPGETKKTPALLEEESRTWWALYALEINICFALGRPDSLGMDEFHNRAFPFTHIEPSTLERVQHPYFGIIKCTVDLSRIIRVVCRESYLSLTPAQNRLSVTRQIEHDLERWLDGLPVEIRPMRTFTLYRASISMRDARYMKRQKLVLSIRYYNVRMMLFACFFMNRNGMDPETAAACKDNMIKCLDSAKETIEIIYETYRDHVYFRTWFYNTTYTLFAVSIILIYIVYEASEPEKPVLFPLVEMAISILETMEECEVAKKAAVLIRRASERAREGPKTNHNIDFNQQSIPGVVYESPRTFSDWWGPLNLVDGDLDSSYLFASGKLGDGFDIPEQMFHGAHGN